VDSSHVTPEELVERSVWTEVSLGYAREHGRRKLARLLGALKDDVEFEGALVALPPGEHLGPARGISPGKQEGERGSRRRFGIALPPGSCSWKRSFGG
jgi:hypothetical protein